MMKEMETLCILVYGEAGIGIYPVVGYSGGFVSPTRLPSYNLLVNFASLLEGYVRWDKKYLVEVFLLPPRRPRLTKSASLNYTERLQE